MTVAVLAVKKRVQKLEKEVRKIGELLAKTARGEALEANQRGKATKEAQEAKIAQLNVSMISLLSSRRMVELWFSTCDSATQLFSICFSREVSCT